MKNKFKLIISIILFSFTNVAYASGNVVCRDYNVIRLFKFLSILIYIIKILVPVILILTSMYSLFKTITSNDNMYLRNEINKGLIKVFVGAFIFFLPTLFNVLFSYLLPIDNSSTFFTECGKCLTDSKFCDELMQTYPEVLEEAPNRGDNSGSVVIGNNQGSDSNTFSNPIIEPPSGANIVSSGKSSSLVYSIEKVSKSGYGTFFVTRVWVKDAYNQLNKYDSPEYGSKLYKPKNILEKAINNKNLKDKIVIGFNASGFYLKGSYDVSSVRKYSKYNKTSVGTLVITDGKVVRNAYDKWAKQWTIMGVTPDQKMHLWQDSKEKSDDIKKQKNDEIINSKIRNTFSFAAPYIIDGQKSSISTSHPGKNSNKRRQAFCQIDENNFLLVTSLYSSEALKRNEVQDLMVSYNCKMATNFDGGGSIALLVKEAGSNEIKVITGNKRALTEVGYFTEK